MTQIYLRDMVDEQPFHGQKCLFLFDGHTFPGVYSEVAMRFALIGKGAMLLQARYWLPLPDLKAMLAEREEAA